ncbi:MAG: hypothetical protein F4184_01040 [Gemmatimonadetes bacterium]|nr:hypothetical protein [Gemmatimonadota bacterium]
MAKINTQNHDGVTLTPALVEHLSSGDIHARIADLAQRRRATTLGQFDLDDLLQRELEYRRYASEARRQPTWPQDEVEQRRAFDALEILPPQQEEDCSLTDQDSVEGRRAACSISCAISAPTPKGPSSWSATSATAAFLSSSP